ncbi:MAG: Succinate--CoA ligase [ADP-forming] subunit beta [Chlamydiae bacterium]|nr:Succinate--CoA ligase [ADP-forming] subunit beta [Chlamydiota bacterium]
MHLHEYQAKTVLKRYGVAITSFGVASNAQEVEDVIKSLNLEKAVVKVQVHAGGRGKAGGVKFANSPDEIKKISSELIGLKIVNQQTGKDGIVAHQVIITPPCDIEKEFYCGIIIDREQKRPTLIISPEGGMEIEEIAEKSPDRILTVPLYEGGVFKRFQINYITKFMGWSGDVAKQGAQMLVSLAKAFWELDASMVEINPLILTPDNQLIALDAKVTIDENALYRQKELQDYYDPTQESQAEVNAKKFDLAYISLDGDIACMVNGAGLAMATMDIIHHYGAEPANFLDVGGSATTEKVTEGFKIILSDPKVKAILVNIFGGIMNCATIAEGLIIAAKELDMKVPIVVRMEGTNVDQGRAMLKDSGLDLISVTSLTEAAQTVVKQIK